MRFALITIALFLMSTVHAADRKPHRVIDVRGVNDFLMLKVDNSGFVTTSIAAKARMSMIGEIEKNAWCVTVAPMSESGYCITYIFDDADGMKVLILLRRTQQTPTNAVQYAVIHPSGRNHETARFPLPGSFCLGSRA